MPVIPNFSSFAQTPNNANAWLGGRASAQKDTEIQNQADQARAHLDMQQKQLAQAAQQSQMELQAKQAMHQQEVLRQQQEMQIKSQYEQQMIGIHQMDLEQKKGKLESDAKAAAQQYAAREALRNAPEGRLDDLLRREGPAAEVPGAYYSAYNKGNATHAEIPEAFQLKGIPGGKIYGAASGPNSYQFFNTATGDQAQERTDLARDRLKLSSESQTFRENQTKYVNKSKEHALDKVGYSMAMRLMRPDPGNVTKEQRALAMAWTARSAELAKMLEEMSQGDGKASIPNATSDSNNSITNSATSGKYKVTW